ncbi:MAG: hypothetical protein FD180_1878 [Planctomycetota bacterium]|nr:MAG: hypothetical protein FD180_1878 [Planctomycetota bacterium]
MEEGRVRKRGSPLLAIAILVAALGIAAGVLRLFLAGAADPLAGNEREAIRVLDSVATLERLWRDGDADGNGVADWWTADWSGFHRALGKNGKPMTMTSGAIAAADAAPLPAGPKISEALPRSPHAGYWFRAIGIEGGYAFAAVPAEPGASGRRVFITREDGRLWAREGSEAPARWPAAADEGMRAAGWTLTRP